MDSAPKTALCRIHLAQVPGFVPDFLAKNPCKSTMCRMCQTLAPLTHMRAPAHASAHTVIFFGPLTDTSPGTSGTSGTSLFYIEKMERKAAQCPAQTF